MEAHNGAVTHIRAMGFHADLWYKQHVTDFDFEAIRVPTTAYADVPGVVIKAGTWKEYEDAEKYGLRAHLPRRDNGASSERDDRLRPRLRLMVANPTKFSQKRANVSRQAEG